jgi:hypothetical protein
LRIHQIQSGRLRPLFATQQLIASGGKPVQMAEEPIPRTRIVASAFPDNRDRGHGANAAATRRTKRRQIARTKAMAQAMFRPRLLSPKANKIND